MNVLPRRVRWVEHLGCGLHRGRADVRCGRRRYWRWWEWLGFAFRVRVSDEEE